jgi:putative nucleotidyltransferase with HDIG domain
MGTPNTMSRTGRLYVGSVIVCGVIVVAQSVATLWISPPESLQWLILAGLTLLSGSFSVKIPTIPARLSVSETFVFAAVLLFGPSAATLIVVLDSVIISLWLRDIPRWPMRMLFNMAAPGVAIWIAAHLFFSLAGIAPLSEKPQEILSLLLPLLALAVCYFLLNSFLIAGAVAFQKRMSALVVWRQNFLWLSVSYFSGASVAALLLPYLQASDSEFFRIIGVILPLLLISYLTLKTSLGRVEDANLHLTELNRLYLSTIETLAMAIDAKDQITHGHIRRVQTYAVALAKSMGVTDAAQIRAIEAAALLHDMGKLAVPEHILNKPGPLTPAEFEKMKLHASVGADILSAIDFPYPVVPIVRHHHENWDGTGYPAGLAGADIPIGARILSVVDCFDALTSDRPYRPRLADKDALRILNERRAKMYDPLVVDSFLRLYPQLTHDSSIDSARSLEIISPSRGLPTPTSDRLEQISASQSETAGLLQLAQELAGTKTATQVGDALFKRVTLSIPTSLTVLYIVDEPKQELVCAHARGAHEDIASEMRIAVGQRLSGWVAANMQSIRNSDAMLDLGGAIRETAPRLRTCMAVPIVIGQQCLGVLALYSTRPEGFTDEHERILEAVARHAAAPFRSVLAAQNQPLNSPSHDAVLYIRVPTGHGTNEGHVERLCAALFDFVRGVIRPGDLVLRPTRQEFVLVLKSLEANAAAVVAKRIKESVLEYVGRQLLLDPGLLYIAPLLHVASPEFNDDAVIRLARHRYSAREQGNDEQNGVVH